MYVFPMESVFHQTTKNVVYRVSLMQYAGILRSCLVRRNVVTKSILATEH